jgi:hypothetical protein
VKNPNPIARAWRLEKRRKELGGGNPHCFYCPESNIECLELDHPVTRNLDPLYTRVVCRNTHRKLELRRDLAGLTKNGQHNSQESENEECRSYLLLMAEDQDSIAELLESATPSPQSIASALRAAAASMRRKAAPQTQTTTPVRSRRYKRTKPANSLSDQRPSQGQPLGGSRH